MAFNGPAFVDEFCQKGDRNKLLQFMTSEKI